MDIKWLAKAVADLQSLRKYIAKDNPSAANYIATRIHQAVVHLQTHPHMGKPGRIPGTRELIIAKTPFLIPYRIKDNVIEILRVLHGRMQWP